MIELAEGDVVGGYVIERRLGRGGMGAVYAARDPSVERRVALKLMDPRLLGAEGVLRFAREAELAARVDGLGGVVRVHARGVHRGAPFIVMELIEGRDLDALLTDATQPLEPARLARHLEQVARALQRCHEAGVLHRDLKPANIIVQTRDDAPFVADFGLARAVDSDRLTLTGELLGTPAYMAPEQALDASRATSPLVDVYSLGAILYHGLAGRPPRQGGGALLQLMLEDPPRPSSVRGAVDRGLEAICVRAMEREPARRYASAGALADDLARWRAGEQIETPKRGRTSGALVLVALLALIGAAIGGMQALGPRPPRDEVSAITADATALALAIEQLVAAVPTQALVSTTIDLDGVRARLASTRDSHDPALVQAAVERAAALSRARATRIGQPPERVDPPRDMHARAADAWAWWRGGDPAEALRRLGLTTPATAALELRLRETFAPTALFAWLRERRSAGDVWPGARPRAVARLATVLRDAALTETPSTETRAAVEAAAALDVTLLEDALAQAADAWRPLLGDGGHPERAIAAARSLRDLLRGRASAAVLRPELLRTLEQLGQELSGNQLGSDPRDRQHLLKWDDLVAALDPGLVPSRTYVERLGQVFGARSYIQMSAEYGLACLRRGAGGNGYSLDGFGQAFTPASVAPLRSDTSAAARLCWACQLLRVGIGEGDLAADKLPAERLPDVVAALDAVLDAPRADLHPRYEVEVRAILADVLLLRAADDDDLRRAARLLAEVWAYGPSPDFAWIAAMAAERHLKAVGAPASDRARALERALPTIRAAIGHDEDVPARRRLATVLWLTGARRIEAGETWRGIAAELESLDVVAPFTLHFSERDVRPRLILQLARSEAVDLADDLVKRHGDSACEDPVFVTLAIEHELARGRPERARRLLAIGRELHPENEAEWAAAERSFEGR